MKNLFKALANFQQECPTIHKGTKGYGYSYSDLPTIFNVINPLLKNNGLGFTQLVNDNTIKTILFHCETGETLESETVIPNDVKLKGMNDFQVLGSAISYLRRYAISSMLGLVTDKDIDAGGEQVKKNPTLTKDGLNYLLTKGTPKEIQTAIKTRTLTDAQRLQLTEKSNG
jgi:hypothetical protein